MPNPRITIETYLGKIPEQSIQVVRTQLQSLNKNITNLTKSGFSNMSRGIIHDMDEVSLALKNGNRYMAINSIRMLAMRQGFTTASQAGKAMIIILKDMFSAVGFLNTAMSIMLSRFGTMIIIFGVVQAFKDLSRSLKDATREFDTASRKLEGIVVPAFGDIRSAMQELRLELLSFTASYGVSLEQLSDTMFFLASAGRNHAQVLQEVVAVQKLVVATSKDMTTTMGDNKQLVETFVGLLNIYGESIKEGANAMERAEHLASIFFGVFKTEQILITELASGLQYSANAAKAMNISIEELVVSIAILNTQMIKGSKAGTSYANALRETIQHADKLKKNFGIDIGDITDGFSLLEKVIKPINKQLREGANRTQIIYNLLQSYNIRSQKSILGLADAWERADEKTRSLMESNEDLAKAFDANADSIKLQEQRFKNLQTILNIFFQTVITGGRGFGSTLKDVNTAMQGVTRVAAAFFGLLAVGTAGLRAFWEIMIAAKLESWGLRGVMEKLGFTFISQEGIINNLQKSWDNLSLLFRYASGQISQAEFEAEALNRGLIDNDETFKQLEASIKATSDALTAYRQSLSLTKKVVDDVGDEISFTSLFEDVAGNRELIASILTPFASLTTITKDTFKNINKEVGSALKVLERNHIETAEVIDEQVGIKMVEAYNDFIKKVEEIPLIVENVSGIMAALEIELIAKLIKIRLDGMTQQEDNIKKSLDRQIEMIKEAHRQILNEYRQAQKLSRTTIGGLPALDFISSDRRLTDMGKITIAPAIPDISEIQNILAIQTKLIATAQEEMDRYVQQSNDNRLASHTVMLNQIDTLEAGTIAKIQGHIIDYGNKTLEIGKIQRKALLTLVDDQKVRIRSIVDAYFQVDKDILEIFQ